MFMDFRLRQLKKIRRFSNLLTKLMRPILLTIEVMATIQHQNQHRKWAKFTTAHQTNQHQIKTLKEHWAIIRTQRVTIKVNKSNKWIKVDRVIFLSIVGRKVNNRIGRIVREAYRIKGVQTKERKVLVLWALIIKVKCLMVMVSCNLLLGMEVHNLKVWVNIMVQTILEDR